MITVLWLVSIFVAAYLGVRMATSAIGFFGELRFLAVLPLYAWERLRGRA